MYGYDYEIICSSKDLTNEIEEMITSAEIPYKRGLHWTIDAGTEKLGWEGNDIKRAVGAVIDMIIESIR